MKPRGHNYSSTFFTKINCQPDTKLMCITTLKVLCLQCAHFKLPSRKKLRNCRNRSGRRKDFLICHKEIKATEHLHYSQCHGNLVFQSICNKKASDCRVGRNFRSLPKSCKILHRYI